MKREFTKINGREAKSNDGTAFFIIKREYVTILYEGKKIRLGREGMGDEFGTFSYVEPPTINRRWELLDGVGEKYGTEDEFLTIEDCRQICSDFESGMYALEGRWKYAVPEDSPLPFMERC